VIDETHRNGLPITAHATFDACIRRVAEFGIDCVEHGGSMSDETIRSCSTRRSPSSPPTRRW
jgi:imidazolonepropionase-like amidohydrolase